MFLRNNKEVISPLFHLLIRDQKRKNTFHQKISILPESLFIFVNDKLIYEDDFIEIFGVKSPSLTMYVDMCVTLSPATESISSPYEDLFKILRDGTPDT